MGELKGGGGERHPLNRGFTVKGQHLNAGWGHSNFKGRVYQDIIEENEAAQRSKEEEARAWAELRGAAAATAVLLSRDQVAADASGFVATVLAMAAVLQQVGRFGSRGGTTGNPARPDARGLDVEHAVACATNALTNSVWYPRVYDARGFLDETHLEHLRCAAPQVHPKPAPGAGDGGDDAWGLPQMPEKMEQFRAVFSSVVASLCDDAVDAISKKGSHDCVMARLLPSGGAAGRECGGAGGGGERAAGNKAGPGEGVSAGAGPPVTTPATGTPLFDRTPDTQASLG